MAAPATRTRQAARTRQAIAPRHPRRVSGPLRPLPAAAPPLRRGSTGVFERLRALPEHRVVDRLLRSRAWIWLIGVLLGGIVAMQVSLLKLNAGISRAVTTTATLERQNAALEGDIARLSASERIQATAQREGMVMPEAGSIAYLNLRPDLDATRAVRRMVPPSDEAASVQANGGREPGVLAVPETTTETTVTDPAATTPTVAADPAATTPTAADPAATTPTAADPAATTVPETETTTPEVVDPATAGTTPDPETGAVAAPGQG